MSDHVEGADPILRKKVDTTLNCRIALTIRLGGAPVAQVDCARRQPARCRLSVLPILFWSGINS